jgi:gliding motility-associated-like protein
MRILILALLISITYTTYAQNIVISDGGTVSTCGGFFYDSGGPGVANNTFYQNNESYTITICPDQDDYLLRLILSQVNIEVGDQLFVYDGEDTSFPLLGTYDDSNLNSGDTIQATSSNTTGCLTFVFVSDNIKQGAGWAGALSCFYPCQPIIANALFEGLPPGSIIRLCKGDTLNFIGFGEYPMNGTLYTQSDGTSSFVWNIEGENGGGSVTGIDTNFVFVTDGIYHIDLTITDNNPNNVCQNTQFFDQIIHVSTTPIFAGTMAELPQICIGETNNLLGVVEPVEAEEDCTPPAGTPPSFIPDGTDMGSGLTYSTSTKIKCFSDQFIDELTDINSLCVNIEHSGLGDLDIWLTCPNGQSVNFVVYDNTNNSNTQWLGEPIDIFGNVQPGVGYDYCFTMNATQTLDDIAATVPNNQTVPAGDYLPIESFSSLIGCPINGVWTLNIRDRVINDNGWVFNWQITFDPSIVPTQGNSFIPTIVNTTWMNADPPTPAIISQNPPNAVAQPVEPGTACYMFQVTDDFGCNYDTTVCFIVLPSDTADFTYPGTPFCNNDPNQLPTFINGGRPGVFTSSPAGLSINSNTGEINIAASQPGTYTITNTVTPTNGCPDVVYTFDIVINPIPEPVIVGDLDYCLAADLTTDQTYTSYEWSNGATTQGSSFTEFDNPITVTVENEFACFNTSDPVNVSPIAQNITNDTIYICQGSSALIHGNIQTTEGLYSQFFSTGGFCDSVSNVRLIIYTPVNAGNDISVCDGEQVTLNATGVDQYTWSPLQQNGVPFTQAVGIQIYTVTGIDTNNCVTTDQVTVTVNALPIVDAGANQTVCESAQVILQGSGSATTYSWSNGVQDGIGFTATLTTNYTVTGTDMNGCQNTDLVSVIVNPLPSVVAGSNTAICIGESVTLSASGNADSYTWDPAIINGVPFTPATTTTYTLTGINNTTGCQNTSQVTVVVNPLPAVNAGPDQTVCFNQTIVLSGSGAVSYTWNNGVDNGVGFPATVTNTYTVTGTDANGCVNTDQVTVTVNDLEDATFTYPAYVFCLTGDIDPIATVTGVQGGLFSASPGLVINLITGAIDITASGAGTFTVTYTSPGTCPGEETATIVITDIFDATFSYPDPSCQIGFANPIYGAGAGPGVFSTMDAGLVLNTTNGQIDLANSAVGTYSITNTIAPAGACAGDDHTTTITINPLPIISASVSDNEICIGDQVIFTGAGSDIDSYSWNNGVINGTLFTPSSTTTYTVTGTDANGCSNTATIDVIVNPLPVISAGSDFAVCDGESIVLNATGTGDNTYSWDNSVLNGVSFVPPVGQNTYTLTGVSNTTGCINTDQIVVTVNALPIVDAGQDQSICLGAPISLCAAGANTYIWNNDVFDCVSFNPTVTNTYTVVGTDVNGCVNSDDVTITVNPLPSVSATSTDFDICFGESVTISASGANGYVWTDLGNEPSYVVSPTVTTTYFVTGQDVNLCGNTAEVTITVNALPIVIASDDQTICIGETVVVNAQGALTYTWNQGLGIGQSHNVSPTSTTTYTVTGTDANGCENTDQTTVNVNQLPSITASVDVSICEGESTTISANGGDSYIWNQGLGNGQSHSVSPTSTTTYTVTGTNTTTTCANTASVTVTVNPNPTINAGADVSVCAGQNVTLNATSNLPSTNIVWNPLVSNGVPFAPTATGTYTATVTNPTTGCSNSDQVLVTVNALPVISVSASNPSICIGSSTTLTATGGTSYTWNQGLTDGPTHTVSPTVTTSYVVTGSNLAGCTSTQNVVVTVNNLPIVVASVDTTICAGQIAVLSATGATSYTWNNGAGTGSPVFVTPTTTTTYTVTGTDGNGCTNSDQVVVTVVASPVPSFTADITSSTTPLNVVFTNNSTNAEGYIWNLGNGTAPYTVLSNDSQNGTYTVVGVYDVILTAYNQYCSINDTIQVEVIPFTNAFIYIPNVFTPNGDDSNDEWWIQVENGKEIAVQVFNRWGNLMIEMNDFTTKWDGNFNGNEASEGTYFYKYRIVGDDDGVLEGHGNLTLIRKK